MSEVMRAQMVQRASVIMQKSWTESVVNVGDRITGQDVTMGVQREGLVTSVVGPIRTPDCGGYRYHIITNERYSNGSQLTAVVYAERFITQLRRCAMCSNHANIAPAMNICSICDGE